MPEVTLKFLGAAETVTGSKSLLEFEGKRILIDCGLFQGLKELRLKNWADFDVDPKTIDAIVLTHAHIDHSGYIPKLIKDGFSGKIFCTAPTLALCKILLPDTGYLLEEEAEYLNRKKATKHHPAKALFTQEDAENALNNFVPRGFHEDFDIVPGIRARFQYAGHILGASSVVVKVNGKAIGFSGDLGRPDDPVFRAPESLPPIDYLVVESTYGDRIHPDSDPLQDLEVIVNRTAQRKGVVLIPAFAVGRSQTLIHFLAKLRHQGRIPEMPMYLNSPMATTATNLFYQFQSQHKLSDQDCEQMQDAVHYVRSVEESKLLNLKHGPMVIISASGMATGGRILHHLKAFAPVAVNTIVLAGYQAAGTRGRSIQDGADQIKMHGGFVPVNAEVAVIENLSAHADYKEILDWISKAKIKPKQVFVTHGEPAAANGLAKRLTEDLGLVAKVPTHGQVFSLI